MTNKTSFFVNKFNVIPINYQEFATKNFPTHFCEEKLDSSNINTLEKEMHNDLDLNKDIREFKRIICTANHKKNSRKKNEYSASSENCCVVPTFEKNKKYISICELIQIENNAPRNLLINLINTIIKNSDIKWNIDKLCKQLLEEMQKNCNNSNQYSLNASVILKKSKKNPWIIKSIGKNKLKYTLKHDGEYKKVDIIEIQPNLNRLLPDCIVGDNKFIFKTNRSKNMISINFTQSIDQGIENYIKTTNLNKFNFDAFIRKDLGVILLENKILSGIPKYSLRYHLCKRVDRKQNSCVFYFNVYDNLGDNINEFIDNTDHKFKLLVTMIKILVVCLNGLKTLHKNGYAHRNLKLKNIFMGNPRNISNIPNHICITNYKKLISNNNSEIFDYWRYFDVNKNIYATDQTTEIFKDYKKFQDQTATKFKQTGGFTSKINTKILPYYSKLAEIQNLLIYQNIDLKMLGVECIKIIEKIMDKKILNESIHNFNPPPELFAYIEILNFIKAMNFLGGIYSNQLKPPLSNFFKEYVSKITNKNFYSLSSTESIDEMYKYVTSLVSKYNSDPEFNKEFMSYPYVNDIVARDCDAMSDKIFDIHKSVYPSIDKYYIQHTNLKEDPINSNSTTSSWNGRRILKLVKPLSTLFIGYSPSNGFYIYDKKGKPISSFYLSLTELVESQV